jgi:hypothetical protein
MSRAASQGNALDNQQEQINRRIAVSQQLSVLAMFGPGLKP